MLNIESQLRRNLYSLFSFQKRFSMFKSRLPKMWKIGISSFRCSLPENCLGLPCLLQSYTLMHPVTANLLRATTAPSTLSLIKYFPWQKNYIHVAYIQKNQSSKCRMQWQFIAISHNDHLEVSTVTSWYNHTVSTTNRSHFLVLMLTDYMHSLKLTLLDGGKLARSKTSGIGLLAASTWYHQIKTQLIYKETSRPVYLDIMLSFWRKTELKFNFYLVSFWCGYGNVVGHLILFFLKPTGGR